MASANPVIGYQTRQYIVGCLNGVPTIKSIYTCDPKKGPVVGSGTNTEEVSFFYQPTATGMTVVDWATAVSDWSVGACESAQAVSVGIATNPDDPAAADTPVYVVVQTDGSVKYFNLSDGSEYTLGANEEFRKNAEVEISETFGCIKDASGITTGQGQLIVVYDEDGEESSRRIVNPADGAVITLAAGEVFGPCSGGLPSETICGCLVDETAGTTRAADKQVPKNSDSGASDYGQVTYHDPTTGAVLTKTADEVFSCGNCPELITCP